jgi:hypothetical protein
MPNIVDDRKSRAMTGSGTVERIVHDSRLAILCGRGIKGHIEIRVFLRRDLNRKSV